MPQVVHFEIAADDPERAAQFYRDVFGWKINQWGGPEDYWLVSTGEGTPGIDGGIMRRQMPQPVVNTIDVADVDEAVRQVTEHGGQVLEAKIPVPGVGYLAYCKDTEGTIFGMMQADPSVQ